DTDCFCAFYSYVIETVYCVIPGTSASYNHDSWLPEFFEVIIRRGILPIFLLFFAEFHCFLYYRLQFYPLDWICIQWLHLTSHPLHRRSHTFQCSEWSYEITF